MVSRRVEFCGALNGRIVARPGETDEEAIQRAEDTMHRLMDRYAKRLGLSFGLEPDGVAQGIADGAR